MASDNITEQVKSYILGTLSAEEKSRFEEKYFLDDELFEEIEIVEDDLVDAYIRRELSSNDLKRFEEIVIASPRLTERVEFARTLAKSPLSHQSPVALTSKEEPFWKRILFPAYLSPSALRWTLAAYTLLLLLGGAALLYQWNRLRTESQLVALQRAEVEQRNQARVQELDKQNSELNARLAEAQAENARLANQLESQQKEVPTPAPKSAALAVFLAPGGTRGIGRENRVVASPKHSEIRLQLGLESNDYSTYSATVKTVEEKTISSRSGLKSKTTRSGKVVELRIPTSQLPKGFYIVELSGLSKTGEVQRLNSYSFRVVTN